MKVKIPEGSIQTDDLKAKLEAEFPDITITKRNKKMLVAKIQRLKNINVTELKMCVYLVLIKIRTRNS